MLSALSFRRCFGMLWLFCCLSEYSALISWTGFSSPTCSSSISILLWNKWSFVLGLLSFLSHAILSAHLLDVYTECGAGMNQLTFSPLLRGPVLLISAESIILLSPWRALSFSSSVLYFLPSLGSSDIFSIAFWVFYRLLAISFA